MSKKSLLLYTDISHAPKNANFGTKFFKIIPVNARRFWKKHDVLQHNKTDLAKLHIPNGLAGFRQIPPKFHKTMRIFSF
jgi:hypothetical protein